jgi:hypothetical protein
MANSTNGNGQVFTGSGFETLAGCVDEEDAFAPPLARAISLRIGEAMAKSVERKTRLTGKSVEEFIDSQESDQVRDDCRTIALIMEKATGARPEMWGTSIVGFGRYTWYGTSGKGVEWMVTAFAPRKANLTIYLWPEFDGKQELLGKLGKHSCGKGCLYVKRLSDVHLPTLTRLIEASVRHARDRRTVMSIAKKAGSLIGRPQR